MVLWRPHFAGLPTECHEVISAFFAHEQDRVRVSVVCRGSFRGLAWHHEIAGEYWRLLAYLGDLLREQHLRRQSRALVDLANEISRVEQGLPQNPRLITIAERDRNERDSAGWTDSEDSEESETDLDRWHGRPRI